MALLDKLGNLTKSVADKTGVMLEVSKLNSQINEERNRISSVKSQLGDYYIDKYRCGEALDADAMGFCAEIMACCGRIEALEQEIQRLKSEPPSQASAPPAAGAGIVCPSCGAQVPAGHSFCGSCGGRLGQ